MEAHAGNAHEHHHHHDEVEVNPADLDRRQALRLAARHPRPAGPVHGLGRRRSDRLRRLLVPRGGPRLRHLPAARPGDRDGLVEPARLDPQVARAGPLLPLVHLPLHPDPVRRADLRLLEVGRRRADRRRRSRPGGDDGSRRRDRDQHRPRARPQARERREVALPGRPRPDRIRPFLHRAQPRPPRPRRDPGGSGQLAPRRELLGIPAAHRPRQPAPRPGRSRPPASTGSASPIGRCATTSSAPGR